MRLKSRLFISTLGLGLMVLASCGGGSKSASSTTGWSYNDPEAGGFEYQADFEQETGPGLVFIEGGTFIMGNTQEDVMKRWNNQPRRVTVRSFYMDETEVRNVDYREYLYWLKRVFADMPEVHERALPDTLVWRRPLAYNEPMVENYFRHPAYSEYPVVGVSWVQATDYADWRTDRVNEKILVDEGILELDLQQTGDNHFDTEAYLQGYYEGTAGESPMEDLDPDRDTRSVRPSDGILLPRYRLPTEAEWEYAALGLVGNSSEERLTDRRMYPWDGHTLRNPSKDERGQFMANFVRDQGDYMGMAGDLNDGGDITVPVDSYYPNDFGLYCMAGNVNEWVQDVYRPSSHQDVNEFSPFRGNVFKKKVTDEEGYVVEPDEEGDIRYEEESAEDIQDRSNYRKADNRNYLDGDARTNIAEGGQWGEEDNSTEDMYSGDPTSELGSTISDRTRVYKGGSWRDRAHWLSPGTRRYLHEEEARDDIGFRCAMTRVGTPASGN